MDRRRMIGALAATMASMTAPSVAIAKAKKKLAKTYPLFGSVEIIDPAAKALIDPAARISELANGFWWSEGPTWDKARRQLYFSDVPKNTAFSWSAKDDLKIFRKPSGLPDGEDATPFDSAGTNGLKMSRDGKRLLVASHGKRAVTMIDLTSGTETPLVQRFEGKKLNSPNDLIEAKDGTIYFTDPPYGLKGQDESPIKELQHNGVYRLRPDSRIELLDATMERPNGIALSPDERTLYVANSARENRMLKSYSIAADGKVTDKGMFFDARKLDGPGNPDGMCVAKNGYIFTTGPGGVLILSPDGTLIARILTEKACANCCFGIDGRTLFVTASDRLGMIPLKITGLGF
jgi:gluconolactonase